MTDSLAVLRADILAVADARQDIEDVLYQWADRIAALSAPAGCVVDDGSVDAARTNAYAWLDERDRRMLAGMPALAAAPAVSGTVEGYRLEVVDGQVMAVHRSGDSTWLGRAATRARSATEPTAKPYVFDGCTESNCTRCLTEPYARGNMEHAGIGSRP